VSNWIKEYQEEVGPPFEFEQFARNATSENIWVGGKPIGIFVYTNTTEVCSIHIVWIKPQFRNQFKEACRYIATWVKTEGYKKIELIADIKVTNWIERYLKLKPYQKVYLTDVDNILEVL
jgi:hypothetical protein